MAVAKESTFGQMIRERRLQLGLTQQKVASKIGASTPYVGHLESGKRHPSDKIVARLANTLGFDGRALYFLAHPGARVLLDERKRPRATSSWEAFCQDTRLRRLHNVTPKEMEMLSRVALLGDVRSSRSFIYILNTIRLTKRSEDALALVVDALPSESPRKVVRCDQCGGRLNRHGKAARN
ncbi:MAG TPA: helix-turn-helix transcriptional regulator [Candidatus Binataceae bacterium]|nr:helix-turn-helix transcriptional regulator [Candidatus Binataceae bacterium]